MNDQQSDGDSLTDRQLIARFVKQRDQRAFAALVERHGGLVMQVCGRILRSRQDAEDAFQAVFLVLARKAPRVGWQDNIANWLYGVAYRVAIKAARRAARRREEPLESIDMIADQCLHDIASHDAQRLLHEEIDRLPDRYRAPLVVCCLEGKSRQEAARQLSISQSALKGRLQRARQMLRMRLARRGLALPVVLLAVGLSAGVAQGAVPSALVAATTAAAGSFVAGNSVGGGLSSQAVQLAQGEIGKMIAATYLRNTAAAALLLLCTAGLGLLWGGQPAPATRSEGPLVVTPAVVVQSTDADFSLVMLGLDSHDADDANRFQGDWKFVTVQDGGRTPPQDQIDGATIVIDEEHFFIRIPDEGDHKWGYSLDPTQSPKTIDFTNDQGKTLLGIYEFADGQLKICFNETPDGGRSTKFVSEAATVNDALMVLQRKDDDAPAADTSQATKDRRQLQGAWKLVAIQDGGRTQPRDKIDGATIVIDGEHFFILFPNEGEDKIGYSLDPSQSPNSIDFTNDQGKTVLGIYEFADGQLKICFNEDPDGDRSTKFVSEAGTVNDVLMVLRRPM